jgi:hypothetical protein
MNNFRSEKVQVQTVRTDGTTLTLGERSVVLPGKTTTTVERKFAAPQVSYTIKMSPTPFFRNDQKSQKSQKKKNDH